MFDLRNRYAFDATEGQIPEGAVSGYGHANEKANCVPASFTAALILAGLPDIDPQRVTYEIYGANYRGGFGDFSRTIAWIRANVPGAPSFTDGPFDFNAAEAAGQAGKVIIVAGWINPDSVTFTSPSQARGFSHASLLAAHLSGDKYVIWNTWTGQLQTYDRAVLAASLYEMSVMSGLYSSGGGSLSGGFGTMTDAQIQANFDSFNNGFNLLSQRQAAQTAMLVTQGAMLTKIAAAPAGTSVDLQAELKALADLKTELDALVAQEKKGLIPAP